MCGPSSLGLCPYKNSRLGHRHTQRNNHVNTQGEDGHLQAKQRGLCETNSAKNWISDFQPPEG